MAESVVFIDHLTVSGNKFYAVTFLSLSPTFVCLSLSPFHVAPLMKSGGSVIFSIVPRASLLPNSSRSSQNSIGPTDRNSLPCRYQSPSVLTIILICAFPLVFTPKAPVPPAHFKKTRFHCDCCWQPNLHIHLCCSLYYKALRCQQLWLGLRNYNICCDGEGFSQILVVRKYEYKKYPEIQLFLKQILKKDMRM